MTDEPRCCHKEMALHDGSTPTTCCPACHQDTTNRNGEPWACKN